LHTKVPVLHASCAPIRNVHRLPGTFDGFKPESSNKITSLSITFLSNRSTLSSQLYTISACFPLDYGQASLLFPFWHPVCAVPFQEAFALTTEKRGILPPLCFDVSNQFRLLTPYTFSHTLSPSPHSPEIMVRKGMSFALLIGY
jgi:hypothetical protein